VVSAAAPELERIVDLFAGAPKELRAQALLEYSRKVPPLPDELAANRDLMEQVPECQTPFFLLTEVGDDNRVTLPILKNLQGRGIQPVQLETDSNFTSSAVVKEARELGTDVNGPVMGNKDLPRADEVTLGDFHVDFKEASNSRCPAGQPLSQQTVSSTGQVSLAVLATVCATCTLAQACPAQEGKGKQKEERVVKTTEEELICAQRRRYETSEEFSKRQAWRAGIEATNSELKRAHGLGKMAVRGAERVKGAVYLKALACNVKRVTVYLGKLAVGRKSKPKIKAVANAAAAGEPNQTREGDGLDSSPGS